MNFKVGDASTPESCDQANVFYVSLFELKSENESLSEKPCVSSGAIKNQAFTHG